MCNDANRIDRESSSSTNRKRPFISAVAHQMRKDVVDLLIFVARLLFSSKECTDYCMHQRSLLYESSIITLHEKCKRKMFIIQYKLHATISPITCLFPIMLEC